MATERTQWTPLAWDASMTRRTANFAALDRADRGLVRVAIVEDHGPASAIAYRVGDRLWAHDDFARHPVTGLLYLCEITEVGPKRSRRVDMVYDEDHAPDGAGEEGVDGVAAGEAKQHEAAYRVRILRTEVGRGYDGVYAGHPGLVDRIYPSLGD